LAILLNLSFFTNQLKQVIIEVRKEI